MTRKKKSPADFNADSPAFDGLDEVRLLEMAAAGTKPDPRWTDEQKEIYDALRDNYSKDNMAPFWRGCYMTRILTFPFRMIAGFFRNIYEITVILLVLALLAFAGLFVYLVILTLWT